MDHGWSVKWLVREVTTSATYRQSASQYPSTAASDPSNALLGRMNRRRLTVEQWRDGALFGARPEDAFYVRIDEVLTPDSERALGRLHLEIGIRPAYPAEFIIVRIGIWQGGSQVSEA